MYGNKIMKPIKIVFKGKTIKIKKSNRGDEFDRNTLYACMEVSQ
jgi:hypothetical protein